MMNQQQYWSGSNNGVNNTLNNYTRPPLPPTKPPLPSQFRPPLPLTPQPVFSSYQDNNIRMNHQEMIRNSFIPDKLEETSLFIPNLPYDTTEESLKMAIDDLHFGHVERIDITVSKTQSGGHVKIGFVHFTEKRWINTGRNNYIRAQMVNGGKYCDERYPKLTLMYNKTPIPATQLNIHQLADSLKMAEQTIIELMAANEKLMAANEKLMAANEKLNYQNNV